MKIQVKDLFNKSWDLKEEYIGWYLDGLFKMEDIIYSKFNWTGYSGIMVECKHIRRATIYFKDSERITITKDKIGEFIIEEEE